MKSSLLALTVMLPLVGAIVVLVRYWDWLVARQLSGPMILAVLLLAGIGLRLVLKEGEPYPEPLWRTAIMRVLIIGTLYMLLLASVMMGLWWLAGLANRLIPLPNWAGGVVFVIGIILYAGGRKIAEWLKRQKSKS